MRKRRSTILLLAVFLIGLSLLLYPSVSNYINTRHQSYAIASYEKGIAKLAATDDAAMLKAAEAYNQKLAASPVSFTLTKEQSEEYERLLDPTDSGIMGSVEIPVIGVSLPIYHGVSDAVLQVGAGHLPGSSLPVGGAGTHCVISGHRGLPSSRLFTDLDQMKNGDLFLLHVLDQTLAYKVDQIRTVDPDETELLAITAGKDYCTLLTCTPYGINTQRLLVRGVRVPYDSAAQSSSDVSADAAAADPMLVASALAVPVFLILLIVLLCGASGKKRSKPFGGENK